MIAALYIDPRGPYPKMTDWAVPGELSSRVHCWGETRDARLYDGPHPVVAHPPCGPWGKQRHNYRGAEHDCAPRAVEQVRRWGGVLEHPAGSLLWDASFRHADSSAPGVAYLPKPDFEPAHGSRMALCGVRRISTARDERGDFCDSFGGYTIEVDQCEWGHVARKRTWLYLVGVPRSALEAPPFPGREPTHWLSGNRRCKTGGSVPPGIKVCSAQQRRRTPPLFAEYLVRLARAAVKP